MITIKIEQEQINAALTELSKASKDTTRLMRTLAGTMQSAVDQNFQAGGRPKWLGVQYRSGKPLVDSATLQNSIVAHSDKTSALVGTNLIYAPIHHFGGVIKPKKGKYLTFKLGDRWVNVKSVTIPARPFLALTPQDEEDLLDDVYHYFANLIK